MLSLRSFTVRYKIWRHYLAEVTPRIYRFRLRYVNRKSRRDAFCRNRPQACDHLFFRTAGFIGGDAERKPAERSFLQHLRESTTTHRVASATCVQSRQVVLELYPDTINFRHFPSEWVYSSIGFTSTGTDQTERGPRSCLPL